ncbi:MULTISPECIES: peptide ABC transporter substrate-binding protein [unclassified Mannheimia]|uniref:peptide ABC transporter substrate-binding protein n=1 Tax=unclassified Mannheimia TaxID=2645054 RepID=UPI00359E909B
MLKVLQAVKIAKKFAKMTACVLLITSCDKLNSSKPVSQLPVESQPSSTELKRAIYSAVFQLDPHKVKVSVDAAPLRDLLVGLMAYNAKGDVVPAIAQNWFTEDEKSWLFILDDKATWSNGKAVTAQDFVASWQRLIDPVNHSPLAKYLIYMGVENAKAIAEHQKPASELGVAALNDHTLEIRLSQPNRQLPEMLAHVALLPTYQGEDPNAVGFISNAAYQIKQIAEKRLVLQARSENVPFQTVEYNLITTIQNYSPFDIVENPLLSQKTNITKFPRLCSYYYEFNFNDEQLGKKEVREALRAMVASANIGVDYGIPSQSVIPHNLVKDREKQWQPIIVEQLLMKAGVSLHEPLKLTLLYDDSEMNSDIANQINRTLSQSDLFHITPKVVDWQTANQLRKQKDYQLIRSGWCADYPEPLIFLQKFHSSSPDNHSGYKNELVDEKLNQLQTETLTQEQRSLLITEINEQLYSDVAVLPLFQYQHRVGIVSSLLGIDLSNDSEVIYSKDLKRISEQKD